MSETAIQAIVLAICTALPPTLVAWGALRQGKRNGEKADNAVSSAEVAASKADEAASKADAVHVETKSIKAEAKIIKDQTDGQFDKMRQEIKNLHEELMQVYRENAALRSILSAREKKPAGEAVRHDDAISTATGTGTDDLEPPRYRRQKDRKRAINGEKGNG